MSSGFPAETVIPIAPAIAAGAATFGTFAPITIAGATIGTASLAGGVAALPLLIGALIPPGPFRPFQGTNVLPPGTNVAQFGITANEGVIPERFTVPRLQTPDLFLGRKLTGRAKPGSLQERNERLAVAARAALSFSPGQAALGEGILQDFEIETARLRANPPRLISGAEQANKGVRSINQVSPAIQRLQFSQLLDNRVKDLALARSKQADRAAKDPVFAAISQAFGAGGIPSGQASQAFLAAFPAPAQAPAPPTLIPQPEAPTPVGVAPITPISQEVPTMATVPTTGLGGFFEGLGGIIQASTPLLQTILPAVLGQQRQPVFLGGGPALAGQQIPGVFGDPRIAQATAAGALLPTLGGIGAGIIGGGIADFFGGGGGNANCITPQVGTTLRLPSRIDVPSPSSKPGSLRFVTYKNMGAPVLFRGDLAACKRVRRVGRMVKKAAGGR